MPVPAHWHRQPGSFFDRLPWPISVRLSHLRAMQIGNAARAIHGVDLVNRLVAADGFNSRETKCQPARMSIARLNGVEGDLQNYLRHHFMQPADLTRGCPLKVFRQLFDLSVS